VEIRHRRTGAPLAGGFLTVGKGTEEHGMARWLARDGLFTCDQFDFSSDRAVLSGWLVRPTGSGYQIIVKDEDSAIVSETRDYYLAAHFRLPVGMEAYRFSVNVATRSRQLITIGLGVNGRSVNPLRDVYFPLGPAKVPEDERHRRVSGKQGTAFSFVATGYSTAHLICELAMIHGRPEGPVLDWGCGCGRIAQFIAMPDLHGCDIDADNVRWCQEHLNGRFVSISPGEQTPYPDEKFSLVYGISIFTHLTAEYEALWLEELRRIVKPHGLILLSTLGGVGAMLSGLLNVLCEERVERQIDVGRNSDLDAVLDDESREYYRNVLHPHPVIYRNWGAHFDVERIYDGVVGSHQDMVVLRKRR
jgi:2-polyprenyl-3-methyl-5-hydroxy-6-metoxy-1,4-benzoquinol methylase